MASTRSALRANELDSPGHALAFSLPTLRSICGTPALPRTAQVKVNNSRATPSTLGTFRDANTMKTLLTLPDEAQSQVSRSSACRAAVAVLPFFVLRGGQGKDNACKPYKKSAPSAVHDIRRRESNNKSKGEFP